MSTVCPLPLLLSKKNSLPNGFESIEASGAEPAYANQRLPLCVSRFCSHTCRSHVGLSRICSMLRGASA